MWFVSQRLREVLVTDGCVLQWAIFHLGDHPLPHYNSSSVVLLGDSCHGTSPHHGSGAGMCIEDSAVLAEMLALPEVNDSRSVEVAFAKFSELRRERGNALVQSSAHQGDLYEWSIPGIGADFAKIKKEMEVRNSRITDVNVQHMCNEAKDALRTALPTR
jgi:salicylate hydroxylase